MSRFLILLLVLSSPALGDQASRLYKEARRAEKSGDDAGAFSLYTRAAGMRPRDKKYRARAELVRARAAQSLAALGNLEGAVALDPENNYLRARKAARAGQKAEIGAPPAEAEIREAEQASEPIEFRPRAERHNFDLRGDGRALYEKVACVYGLEVVFDADFTPGPPLRFRLEDADFRQAARALMALTGTFLVPVHERVGLVVKDTPQKRNEMEPMMAALVPIPTVMTTEEANEVGRTVQQVLEIKRLAVDTARRQVLLRDTVTKVRLAKALYQELSRKRAEVMIDIDLLAVSRSSLTNLGLTLPSGFPVSTLSTFGNNQPAAPGSSPLLGFGLTGGETLFGVQVAGANLEADWTQSEAQQLSSFRLRATDGLAASMHIGDKFPIVNALFSPIVITDQIQQLQQSGNFRQPFPSFTFEDLGLVLKVTPRIHDSREISLTLEAEFRLLTGASLNGLPVIASRKFSSAVRLREGESSIVSGLAVVQVSRTVSGVAGLSEIPLIGRLFRHNSWQTDQNELLITITPRLTSLPPAEQFPPQTLGWGTESRPVSPI